MSAQQDYPATLTIDYPGKMDRLTTFWRGLLVIPIFIILSLLTSAGTNTFSSEENTSTSSALAFGIVGGLFAATALMILFRQRYPKWWFDFNLELNRFSTRVEAYFLLLTDKYPSTEDEQSVHMSTVYPDVKQDLNRWLPLVKWFLAIPHYLVLFFLYVAAILATIIAWFAILITGQYPRSLFDFVVGVTRWTWRVTAYVALLTTDKYPPFSLD